MGAFVKPGDVITTIYDFKTLKVEASVPEAYVGRIKIEDTVRQGKFLSGQFIRESLCYRSICRQKQERLGL